MSGQTHLSGVLTDSATAVVVSRLTAYAQRCVGWRIDALLWLSFLLLLFSSLSSLSSSSLSSYVVLCPRDRFTDSARHPESGPRGLVCWPGTGSRYRAGEVIRKCLLRRGNDCSYIEHLEYKLVYKRYASLFFIVGVDKDEVRVGRGQGCTRAGRDKAGENFTFGGGGLEPPQNFFRGVAERGSKDHKLSSSIEMPEMLPPTISKCRGLFPSCVAYGRSRCGWVCRSLGLLLKFGNSPMASGKAGLLCDMRNK